MDDPEELALHILKSLLDGKSFFRVTSLAFHGLVI